MTLAYKHLDPEEITMSDDFILVQDFLKMTGRANIGWHYVIDLTWIYSQVKNWPRSYTILDAGGGIGPTQFLLAELGFDVVNIDLLLPQPKYAYLKRYDLRLRKLDSHKESFYSAHLHGIRNYKALARSFYTGIRESIIFRGIDSFFYDAKQNYWQRKYSNSEVGKINWITGNLCNLAEIQDSTFDAVVSLSSIEHIPLENLKQALSEIERTLKTDAKYAVTTSKSHENKTWFHEPSKGLCFSESDIEKIFKAKSSNNVSAKSIASKYKENEYLRKNLAKFYSRSGDNGMPWGKWDPKYIPIGIFSN